MPTNRYLVPLNVVPWHRFSGRRNSKLSPCKHHVSLKTTCVQPLLCIARVYLLQDSQCKRVKIAFAVIIVEMGIRGRRMWSLVPTIQRATLLWPCIFYRQNSVCETRTDGHKYGHFLQCDPPDKEVPLYRSSHHPNCTPRAPIATFCHTSLLPSHRYSLTAPNLNLQSEK